MDQRSEGVVSPVSMFGLIVDGRAARFCFEARRGPSRLFKPAIPINSPPYDAVIWFQGIDITHAPLRPGTHTFALHAKNTQAAFGSFFEYNNTWTVKVLP